MKRSLLAATLIALAALSGCASIEVTRTEQCTGGGAAIGALAGPVGALVGAVIGHESCKK